MKRRFILLAAFVVIILVVTSILVERVSESSNTTIKSANTDTTDQPSDNDKPQAFDSKKFSTTDPASIWVVVNKQRPLNPKTYAPADLTSVGNGQYMRAEAATALKEMFADAKALKIILTAGSGYRSYTTQVSTYASEVKNYGQAVADSESARPGFSEHQTGLAIDIDGGGCNIEDCFGDTAEGKWAAANAYRYGFILRYPADRTGITGYRTEAWHFRYVGKDLAAEMHRTHTETLEEFFGLGAAPDYN
jgi:D-alanyl-D-alanine carboxypeptidase